MLLLCVNMPGRRSAAASAATGKCALDRPGQKPPGARQMMDIAACSTTSTEKAAGKESSPTSSINADRYPIQNTTVFWMGQRNALEAWTG